MRIGILGIGGVGGYFGGKLAREYASAGSHEIIFIARGEHLHAIQHNGLQLFTREGDYVAWPNIATDNPAVAGMFDLVFFCVKSYSLEDSAHSVKTNIHKNTVVIPLLNGVESADRLRLILPDTDIIGGCVYIISHIDKPGVIRQEDGACKLIFGTDDDESSLKYSAVLNILLRAKINAKLTGQISEALWEKYLLMCPLGSLTAATGKTYGALMSNAVLKAKLQGMMEEVVAVARARKVYLPGNAVDRTMEMAGRFASDAKTSMQLDKEKGRQTEVDTLTGFLCRAGRESGIPTPLHDEVYQQILR
ncbi:MAG TPA: 2-dehydropantoate 2-reductase [Smithellaceae bacterium]|jgi:2-dehydropantoate 2-reductase|nr:2-dehydropantoate 2-reductase [Smithellaceae bacterium]HOG81118.1 2-dehydropantoate 2-reductase [Smithellaceae bacterium]HRY34490.1 2-dehydropantoate 2-reductase [Smithellaceae bacterium]